jgi:hypothetical protein
MQVVVMPTDEERMIATHTLRRTLRAPAAAATRAVPSMAA